LAVPICCDVTLYRLVASKDELGLIGVVVLIYSTELVRKTEECAGQSKIKGQEKLPLREMLKLVLHRKVIDE
jgi:hypothetical protein